MRFSPTCLLQRLLIGGKKCLKAQINSTFAFRVIGARKIVNGHRGYDEAVKCREILLLNSKRYGLVPNSFLLVYIGGSRAAGVNKGKGVSIPFTTTDSDM